MRSFLKTVQVIDYTRAPSTEAAGDVLTLADAEDLPGHGDAVRVRLRPMNAADGTLPGAPRARRGASRTAPRSSTCRCCSTSTRTRTRPSPEVASRDGGRRGSKRRASLNRYPDREATRLRAALAAYLGHGLSADRVWAANGSNEVMLQVLQAFGGPGPVAPVVRADVLDVPGVRPRHLHPLGGGRSRRGLRHRPGRRGARDRGRAAGRGGDRVAEQPDRYGGGARHDQAGLRRGTGCGVVDEAYAEFRRAGTPSALVLLDDYAHLAVTRTMSKAFAFAGGRLGYVASRRGFVDALRVVRLPYHLSSVTQAVALAALAHARQN